MKWVVALTFSLITVLAISQQKNDYYVIRVNGSIINTTTGKSLQVKDKFSAEDEVTFSSKEDFVVVISSIRGHLILKPNKSHDVSGELRYYVKENLIPMQQHTSTRGRYTEFYKEKELKQFFENRPFLVLEENRFWLSKDVFSLNDSSYLFIMYNRGEKKVEYKLPYNPENQELLIDRSAMFRSDGERYKNTDCDNYKLYYYDGSWNTAFEIINLDLVFATNKEIKIEIDLLRSYANAGIDKKAQMANIHSYIRFVYGNFDEEALNMLIND